MLCARCKKNIAVVYITKMENGAAVNEGLCMLCAKALGVQPITNMMDKLGLSEEDMEEMGTQIMDLIGGQEDLENTNAATVPFLNSLFGNTGMNEEQSLPFTKKKTEEKTREDSDAKTAKKNRYKFLDNYCINLTARAEGGTMDRIIGRERELLRVVQILNRRTKNNPCLIGEPGVGKTAIAEALAQRIAENRVPPKLLGKQVYMMDLTGLVAGTQFRGQFESRMKGLIEDVKRAGNVILFCDEVHSLVGAGDADGSMNAANILKPALSRGEIQLIGATTLAEYRKNIEKDSALERRFQPVMVTEPSVEDTVRILSGIKQYYEVYHSVRVDDEVIRQAVLLSERYITDRYLPDKAIDLLDEACSDVNLRNRELSELVMLENELSTLRAERENLLLTGDEGLYQRIADIKIRECRLGERIAELRSPEHVKALTVEDLARVIELWTSIPASKIAAQEFEKLSRLEERLKQRIVGQDEAITAVARAIRRNRVGVSPKRKPVSMIFAGPTGVGKTELVKTIAADLFDNPDALIRVDMSEYMEKHSVSRIIGSPPGYVGYDEAGQLTEKIRRRPYSVILFDEIEKAHADVLNVLLQILDDGRITDAHGRVVNFENAVIIMTTNAGSEKKEGTAGFNQSGQSLNRDRVMKALNEFLRPEFLNRVDEIIIFSPLTREHFIRIAEILLSELSGLLKERNIHISWDEAVVRHIADHSFDEKYGARNLRRFIQKEMENRIASILIDHYEENVTHIAFFVEDGHLADRWL